MNTHKHKQIKLLIIILFAFLTATGGIAQETELINPSQYLFGEFTKGKVAMKAGRDLNLVLNYNIVTEKVVFMQKGEIYDLTKYDEVDTVYIYGRSFIPAGKAFYEVTVVDRLPLYIQHRGSIQDQPRPAAYGGTSLVSSSTYIDNIPMSGQVYRLQNDPTLIIKAEKIYWTRINGEWKSFTSSRQMDQVLLPLNISVTKHVKQKKYKFDNPENITELMVWCNTQLQ